MEKECPSCGAIGYTLTGIVRQGVLTPSGLLKTDSVDTGFPFADTRLDVSLASGIAATLAAPMEPKLQKPRVSCLRVFLTTVLSIPLLSLLVAGVVAALMLGGQAAIGGQPDLLAVLAPVVLLATGGGGLVGLLVPSVMWYRRGYKQASARYEQDLVAHVLAMDRYDRLRYCQRDDLVYDPATGEAFPPEQLVAHLNEMAYSFHQET